MPVKPALIAPVVGLLVAVWSSRAPAQVTAPECAAAQQEGAKLSSAGRLSAARARFQACAATECPSATRDDCSQQLAAIDAITPRLALTIKDPAGADVHAVRVTVDGAPLVDHVDGTPIPVDPGEHHLSFESEGFHKRETTIVAREPQGTVRLSIFLEPLNAAPEPPLQSVAAARSAAVDAESARTAGRTQRAVGIGLGVAGLGCVAAGAVFSIMAKVTYDHAISSECAGDPQHCTAQGASSGSRAHDQAAVATLEFASGGVLLATAAVLYFTAPKPRRVALAPTLTTHGGALSVLGRW